MTSYSDITPQAKHEYLTLCPCMPKQQSFSLTLSDIISPQLTPPQNSSIPSSKLFTTVIMSKEYEGQDLLDIAARAERDLNSSEAKGSNRNDTSGSSSGQF